MDVLSYQTVTNEIPVRGIGYLILNDPDALKRGVDELISKGAVTIYAKGALEEGEQEGLQITHAFDVLVMERDLTGHAPAEGKLRLERMSRNEVPAYIETYNECFRTVPHGATIDRSEVERLTRPEERAGLAWLGTRPVGFYDCATDTEIPEMHALGLIKLMRGKGLGRELLRSALDCLAEEGYTRCRMTVSTANAAAFGLCRAEGFTVAEKRASWYEVCRKA